jgi:hypothetical protein
MNKRIYSSFILVTIGLYLLISPTNWYSKQSGNRYQVATRFDFNSAQELNSGEFRLPNRFNGQIAELILISKAEANEASPSSIKPIVGQIDFRGKYSWDGFSDSTWKNRFLPANRMEFPYKDKDIFVCSRCGLSVNDKGEKEYLLGNIRILTIEKYKVILNVIEGVASTARIEIRVTTDNVNESALVSSKLNSYIIFVFGLFLLGIAFFGFRKL